MTRAFELRRRYMFLSSRSRIGKHRAGLAGEQRVTASEITPWCVARDGFERVCDVTYCIISVNRQTRTQYTGLGRIDYRLLLATSPCFFPPHTQTHTLSLSRARWLVLFVFFFAFLCFPPRLYLCVVPKSTHQPRKAPPRGQPRVRLLRMIPLESALLTSFCDVTVCNCATPEPNFARRPF